MSKTPPSTTQPNQVEPLCVNMRPSERADGQPQHVFYEERDESPLASKLFLWGGYSGVVSFEAMLIDDKTPTTPRNGTSADFAFLHSFKIPIEMWFGAASTSIFRFICLPELPYTGERMPTAADIVRDLRNEAHFSSCIQDMTADELPYIYSPGDCKDEVHTDRESQIIFAKIEGDDCYDDMRKSLEAHTELEAFVKYKRLYYVLFHLKPSFEDLYTKFVDNVYCFAVGVSPHSGNLVGVFTMQVCHNLCD